PDSAEQRLRLRRSAAGRRQHPDPQVVKTRRRARGARIAGPSCSLVSLSVVERGDPPRLEQRRRLVLRGTREEARAVRTPVDEVIQEAGMGKNVKILAATGVAAAVRSEEHTSELQSRSDLVC